MSRILTALGVVAAMSVVPVKLAAVPLFPPPTPPAIPLTISFPGSICSDLLPLPVLASSYAVPNAIIALAAPAAPQTISCPLARPFSGNPSATVILSGNIALASGACMVFSTDGNGANFYGASFILPGSPPGGATVPAPADAVLSVRCTNFVVGAALYGLTVSI